MTRAQATTSRRARKPATKAPARAPKVAPAADIPTFKADPEKVQRFIKASEAVSAPEPAPAADVRYGDYYRLLRRVLIGQANGDFDAGEKLASIVRDVEGKMTEEAFDACMDKALRRMGGA